MHFSLQSVSSCCPMNSSNQPNLSLLLVSTVTSKMTWTPVHQTPKVIRKECSHVCEVQLPRFLLPYKFTTASIINSRCPSFNYCTFPITLVTQFNCNNTYEGNLKSPQKLLSTSIIYHYYYPYLPTISTTLVPFIHASPA